MMPRMTIDRDHDVEDRRRSRTDVGRDLALGHDRQSVDRRDHDHIEDEGTVPNHRMPSSTWSHCTATTGHSMGPTLGAHKRSPSHEFGIWRLVVWRRCRRQSRHGGHRSQDPAPPVCSAPPSRARPARILRRGRPCPVRRLVPFDASCWLSLDPATMLPTSHFSREYGFDHLLALAANESLEDDTNKFADLARGARPVGTLTPPPTDAPNRAGATRRS